MPLNHKLFIQWNATGEMVSFFHVNTNNEYTSKIRFLVLCLVYVLINERRHTSSNNVAF